MITDMKQRGAKRSMPGAWEQSLHRSAGRPLRGIYKLGADPAPRWASITAIQISEESAKASFPGSLQVRRVSSAGREIHADAIYKLITAFSEPCDHDLEQKTKRNPSKPLIIPICSCDFPGRATYLLKRRVLRRRANTVRKQLSCAPPEIFQPGMTPFPIDRPSNDHCTSCDQH